MDMFRKTIKVAKDGSIRIPPGIVVDDAGLKPKMKLKIESELGKIMITQKVEVPKEQKEMDLPDKPKEEEPKKDEPKKASF